MKQIYISKQILNIIQLRNMQTPSYSKTWLLHFDIMLSWWHNIHNSREEGRNSLISIPINILNSEEFIYLYYKYRYNILMDRIYFSNRLHLYVIYIKEIRSLTSFIKNIYTRVRIMIITMLCIIMVLDII